MTETTRNLITLDTLDRPTLETLLDAAEHYLRPNAATAHRARLAGEAVALLFCEPSTRTRFSFELAARRLGADVLTLNESVSSLTKGETLADTLAALAAMDVRLAVVRHREEVMQALTAGLSPGSALVSAGEGTRNHPTQGLLDALTIRRHRPDLKRLTVAIVGDIAHSRVARSTARALALLGIGDLRLIGPPAFLPAAGDMPGTLTTRLDAGLDGADVVMALRIQRERMAASECPDTTTYRNEYGLNHVRLTAHAKPDVLLMHPGPVNWGVELDPELKAWPHNVIEEQIHNGVAVRMAVLDWLAGERA
ncbi:MAG: aspartate carbamoyltransferase catalytic subunit [Gammaproteobacteria bacterium]